MIPSEDAAKGERSSPAQRAGKRYEQRVMAWLQTVFPARPCLKMHMQSGGAIHATEVLQSQLEIGPWFMYVDDRGPHVCQPDAIIRWGTSVVVVEVKRSHTADAWWQLRRLYEPVVSMALRTLTHPLEICRTYDPAVYIPDPVELLDDVHDAQLSARTTFGVLQWR